MLTYQINGTTITRKSDRKYQYAIISEGQTSGKAYAFAGSKTLAEKALASCQKYSSKKLVIAEVTVKGGK